MTLSEEAPLRLAIGEMNDSACQVRQWLEAHSDDEIREASALPAWTRAQVYAHLRGISAAMARQLEYAARGELIELYDGGMDGRNADIARLAALEQPELLTAVQEAFGSLAAAIDALSDADLGARVSYREGNVSDALEALWRELVIHHTDLLIGFTSAAWSPAFCRHLFEFLEARVPEKTRLVLQPLGQQPVTLSNGNTSGKSYVITGQLTDIASWLAGRAPLGQLEAWAAADAVELPALLPWPSGVPVPQK
ncbi:maleylpyruvate isomerase [Psychromicrobium silvestre]|uniref:Maleylpyruvate isomerase n=1 Tax=Psychromicrobium silvestre TaxID=1645614 RepID=A0A7Y9LQN2_9MICC|nr:maleylpyruvate isomerase family mycothiol-dependent enzyme [Psychromicrobium silvestre]NYE93812.1 maleylpyruvate isomerase [Psychromicrobium silvestre]